MKKFLVIFVALSIGFALGVGNSVLSAPQENAVAFPSDYRSFTHVKSMVITEGHPLFDAFGGIHHVYANDLALSALKAGKAYPDGAIFVFDLLEAESGQGAFTEGKRKVLAVMVKDAKKFSETGGWGFQAFAGGDPSSPVVKDAKKDCFACHEAKSKSDYVFSTFRN